MKFQRGYTMPRERVAFNAFRQRAPFSECRNTQQKSKKKTKKKYIYIYIILYYINIFYYIIVISCHTLIAIRWEGGSESGFIVPPPAGRQTYRTMTGSGRRWCRAVSGQRWPAPGQCRDRAWTSRSRRMAGRTVVLLVF